MFISRHRRAAASFATAASLTVCLAGVVAPVSAHAASTITALSTSSADPIAGEALTFTIAGTTDDPGVQLDLNAEGTPCAPTAVANASRRVVDVGATLTPSTFRVTLTWKKPTVGSYTACAYLEYAYADETSATSQLRVSVRPPRTSLAMRLPGARLPEYSTVRLEVNPSSEVERRYFVEVNRAGVPCGPSMWANEQTLDWIDEPVAGAPGPQLFHVMSPFAGRYHLCGYVGEEEGDPNPTTVVDGPTFTVGPPPRCLVSRAPRRLTGTVRVTCTGTTYPITVTAQRGRRVFTASADLSMGTATFPARALGLRRGRRVQITVRTIDGEKAGARILRLR